MISWSEHTSLVKCLPWLCLCEIFALSLCCFNSISLFLLLSWYCCSFTSDQSTYLKIFLFYLILQFPYFFPHRIDLNEQLRILPIFLSNLNFPLLIILLIGGNSLIKTNLEMIPNPIKFSKWTISSLLNIRIRLSNPGIWIKNSK